MSDPAQNPKVCFTVTLGREVGQRVAQLLAMGELMGPCWLRATLMWLQLLPNRTLRVVLSVDPSDLGRVLSVDKWVDNYVLGKVMQPLEITHVPGFVYAESWEGGAPRSNLASAKSLAELLLLLLRNLHRAHDDDTESCFWQTIHNTRYDTLPPPLTDGQCESLMEMADAWRDHIVSVWAQPGMHAFERLSRQPPLTEKVMDEEAPEKPGKTYIRFKPSDFPKLSASPNASPSASACRFKPVAPVDKSEAGRLWKVAWLDQSPQARIWLGCGASPQSLAGGV